MSLMKIESFEEQLEKIRGHLPDYLKEHGYDITNGRKIKCINPEHDDRSPSMSAFEVKEGTPAVHCFSCGYAADIFQAAHVIEHRPIQGPGFIDDNVLYLAKKYDIDIPTKPLTEEEIYEMNTYQAYRLAAEYISRCTFGENHLTELNTRGWTEQFVRTLQVGCCDSFQTFRAYLKNRGFSAKFLDEIDLGNDKIFSPDNLIFTVHDDNGRPVGFAARNLKFDGVKDDNGRLVRGPKFNNTKTTGAKCNIYRKSERLYLLHKAKKKSPPLYIFEGYGDALTSQQAGLLNSVGIGALELSEHHLNTCRRNGIYDVIICLDSDERGMAKARALLDEVLQNVHDIRIRFIFLPEKEVKDEEGNITFIKVDPDIFIREQGLEAFLRLTKIEPFSWRLQEFELDDAADSETICFSMIPIILNEPSHIKREGMVKELSECTGYSTKVIKEELDRLKDTEAAKIQRAKDGVVSDIILQLGNKSDSYEAVLQGGMDKIYQIEKEHSAGSLDTATLVNDLLAIKEYGENEDLHVGLKLGDQFKTKETALSGDLRGKMLLLGGTANTGKTTQFVNWSWNLATQNKDVLAIMLSIDDSAKDLVPRYITYDIAQRNYKTNKDLFNLLEINHIARPFIIKDTLQYDAMMEERNISWQNVTKLAGENKLAILDGNKGKSIDFISTTVRNFREKFPEKHIIMFIDNFHLIDSAGEEEGRFKYKKLSSAVKGICTAYDATIVCTVEYTKIPKGVKPSNTNIAETGQLDYDSNATMHLYNEDHDLKEESFRFFYDGPDVNTRYPIIEEDFGKNKISAYKANTFYRFYPEKAFYYEMSRQEVDAIELTNRQLAQEHNKAMQEAILKEAEDKPLNTFGT